VNHDGASMAFDFVGSWPIATLPQEFMSALPPKADKPEPTRRTQLGHPAGIPARVARRDPCRAWFPICARENRCTRGLHARPRDRAKKFALACGPMGLRKLCEKIRGRYYLLPLGKAGESRKGGSESGSLTSIVRSFKQALYRECAMDEVLRLVIVSLGTFGILAYLVYVARTEGSFNRRR
jgi:hypothetical protein